MKISFTKLHLLSIGFLFSFVELIAQPCALPSGNLFLRTQTEVNDFLVNYGACTSIPAGSAIIIEDDNNGIDDINNLAALSALTVLDGNLTIRTNALLNLDDLMNLTTVNANLIIQNNSALVNIDALSNLTSVGGNLYVGNNAMLADLNGLSNIMTVGNIFRIYDNPLITDLNDLSNLTSLGAYLEIVNNATLTDIAGLSNLNFIGTHLYVLANPLTNLTGLEGLTSINGILQIGLNPNLINIDALNNITSVGSNIWIYDNASLENLNGLGNITTVGGFFRLTNNSNLNACCATCPLLSNAGVTGFVDIQNNLSGCNSETEITACMPCGIAPVPTLGQWGLILLALFLLNLGLISILQSRYHLAGISGTYFQNLPFVVATVLADRKAFLQQYLAAGLFIIILFAISMLFFNYELMPFDVLGSIFATGLLAFLMRVLELRK